MIHLLIHKNPLRIFPYGDAKTTAVLSFLPSFLSLLQRSKFNSNPLIRLPSLPDLQPPPNPDLWVVSLVLAIMNIVSGCSFVCRGRKNYNYRNAISHLVDFPATASCCAKNRTTTTSAINIIVSPFVTVHPCHYDESEPHPPPHFLFIREWRSFVTRVIHKVKLNYYFYCWQFFRFRSSEIFIIIWRTRVKVFT